MDASSSDASSTEAARGRRRLAPRLLVAGATLVLTLVVLELGARLWFHATGNPRGMGFDPELGFRPLPSIEKSGPFWGRDEPARTNSQGWRDAEHAFEKPAGVTRIVALGDSFTFGVDVDYGERFSEVLERDVASLEVVNLGVNAYGTCHELRALEVEGLRYSPDVVVLVVFLGNDLDDVRNRRKASWPCPWFRHRVDADGSEELELVRPAVTWDVRLRTSSYLGEALAGFVDRRARRTERAPEWEMGDTVPLFGALVERMRDASEAAGARFLAVLTYPSERLGSPPTEREARARAELGHRGVELVDALGEFQRRHAAGEVLFATLPGGAPGHWNARGHEVIAELVEAALRDRGWLD